ARGDRLPHAARAAGRRVRRAAGSRSPWHGGRRGLAQRARRFGRGGRHRSPAARSARRDRPDHRSSGRGFAPRGAARRGRADRAAGAGLGGLLLFGLPETKDERGESSADPFGPVPAAIRAIRKMSAELALIPDVCLCEYTSHGHCGVVRADGTIDNDATLPLLADAARAYADAGADLIAPSDMMDGRVAAIRAALDASGHEDTAILSYAAKF